MTASSPSFDSKAALLSRLQAQIDSVERRQAGLPDPAAADQPVWQLGEQSVDSALREGGLAPAALHEVVPDAYPDGPAAQGFAVALTCCRLRADLAGPVVWAMGQTARRAWGRLSAAGLVSMGLPIDRALLVKAARDRDVLWALEETVREGVAALAIGEVDDADLTQTRRLQLAAEDSGTPLLLLRRRPAPSVARTRWRIAAAPSGPLAFDPQAPGAPRWSVRLEKAAGGPLKRWILEWDHDTHRFRLPRPMADRSTRPHLAPRRAPGRQAGGRRAQNA